ncbi:von Willebrand factor D and EGF domain-containing protein-like [Saccostrea echinata]|uniref:von Willebrand factor D and EGF domain-containing protein-like n=1 Tax=Saccostrea echinata TaxID=191078 RepID=UPI002A7FC763|nr:von Willebrand factor D and EGF domain-containing protein-like [Saccostrea echinata]
MFKHENVYIKVDIREPNSVWKEKHCGSYTDPHMLTFDGYKYECQEEGTYILYKNAKFNQEVQVKHHRCHPHYSYPRCTCAVAARSGGDIFTVNICYGQTFINFPLCEDRAFKVMRKNDKYYQVLFPTGTLVEILIVAWPYSTVFQINVKIFPSPPDVGNTNGLCGVLDGTQHNDLTRRDGTVDNPKNFRYHSPPRVFFRSWLYGTVESCKFKTGKPFQCFVYPDGSKRRKRDLSHLTRIMEFAAGDENQINFSERSKRQIYDVRTEKEAEEVCIKAFEETDAITTCRQYDSDISKTAVHNCISDVMMTGDNNITKIHIEATLQQCSSLVLFNSTFQEEQPDVTHLIESLCPNNCSGNGECNEGNCTCGENFAGSDCSFDILGPPNIRHISDFGFCDKSYEECDEITLYGELFLEKMKTDCFITRKTFQQDGTHSKEFFQSGLEPRTLFEGYCPLSYSTESHWVTEFTFNVSNDGIRFTDTFNVYTYQSDCQEFKNISGNISFTLKSGYCFINGRCYIDGGTNRDNQCDLCNVTLDSYSWSFNPDHCLINGECYVNGEIMGTNPCSACLPSMDKWNWSNNPGYCYIDGICYFDDQFQLNNDCYKCNYTRNRTEWTFNEGHCFIDDQCYKAGESHQKTKCMTCDPDHNRNNWTLNTGKMI